MRVNETENLKTRIESTKRYIFSKYSLTPDFLFPVKSQGCGDTPQKMTQAPPLSTVVAETGKCKLPRRVSSRDVVTDAVSQTSVGIYNVSKSRLMILTRVYTEPWLSCPNSFTGNSEAHAGELNHFQRSEWGFVTVSMVSSTREKKAKALGGEG